MKNIKIRHCGFLDSIAARKETEELRRAAFHSIIGEDYDESFDKDSENIVNELSYGIREGITLFSKLIAVRKRSPKAEIFEIDDHAENLFYFIGVEESVKRKLNKLKDIEDD